MESERPIEKALRDCAQKRRDQAGPPPELHPATRKLLQAEVARKYPAAQRSAAAAPAWWKGFWPRFAIGAAALAIAAILAGVLGVFNRESTPSVADKGTK